MSKSHRRHEAPSRAAKRGPKPIREERPSPISKSHKQTRPNDRARLRKEYLDAR